MALSDIVRSAEQALNKTAVKIASKRGWVPAISGYTGYGSQHSIRIYGRILAVDPDDPLPLAVGNPDDKSAQRGWRQFLTVQLTDHPFTVTVGDKHIHAHTIATNGSSLRGCASSRSDSVSTELMRLITSSVLMSEVADIE